MSDVPPPKGAAPVPASDQATAPAQPPKGAAPEVPGYLPPAPNDPTSASPAAPVADVPDTSAGEALKAQLERLYPWLAGLGLDLAFFQEAAATAASSDELLATIRASSQYRARFPAIRRPDGSLLMNEAQYMQTETEYRRLLRQYGYDVDSEYSDPASLVGFFNAEMDSTELQSRLDTYHQIQQGSQEQRDAFYVYAGLDVTVDDLYRATVDPAFEAELSSVYSRAIAGGSLDYEQWITRATEVGLQRVADTLGGMEAAGALTGAATQAVLATQPEFARQVMDAIYTGGQEFDSAQTLSLVQLLEAFEYAAVGAAATRAGLELPTKERLAEIRQAGVERQQQIEAYTNFGANRDLWNAASQRSGGGGFTQTEFEGAAFFGNVAAGRELGRALAYEQAQGADQGEFRFSEDRGRLVQRGLAKRV